MRASSKSLIDTDTLSLYIKKSPNVVAKAQHYLSSHHIFTFSIITRFEILRGMKANAATRQLTFFNELCRRNEIVNLDDHIIDAASGIYADLRKQGQLVGDADILIAATALHLGIPVVTNNENHFSRISGLEVLNWNR